MSLNWSSEEARPGEEVSLALTALEPRSQVGIVVMGMQDDNTPEEDQDFKVTPVWRLLSFFFALFKTLIRLCVMVWVSSHLIGSQKLHCQKRT